MKVKQKVKRNNKGTTKPPVKQLYTEEDKIKNDLKKAEEVKLIQKAFIKWSKKTPTELTSERYMRLLENYTLKEDEVVVRIFDYKPKEEDEKAFRLNINDKGDKLDNFSHRFFPFVKVLYAHESLAEEGIVAGGIFPLNDLSAMTVDNPEYEIWRSSEANKSNERKVGQEPPKLLSNLKSNYGKYIFLVDKLKTRIDEDDQMTFRFFKGNLQPAIKDVNVIVDDINSILSND